MRSLDDIYGDRHSIAFIGTCGLVAAALAMGAGGVWLSLVMRALNEQAPVDCPACSEIDTSPLGLLMAGATIGFCVASVVRIFPPSDGGHSGHAFDGSVAIVTATAAA
jgi:MFS family permease